MSEVRLVKDTKPKTLGQFLARMLRTAVVECQAVEAGRHPEYKLDMAMFGMRRLLRVTKSELLSADATDPNAEEAICGCLGGIYAMLGRGLPMHNARTTTTCSAMTKREEILDGLRRGDLPRFEELVGSDEGDEDLVKDLKKLKPVPGEIADKVWSLISKDLVVRGGRTERDGYRASWNTYLKACTLLESYS